MFLQLFFFSPGLKESELSQIQGFSLGLLLSNEETGPGLLPVSHMRQYEGKDGVATTLGYVLLPI